MSSKDIGPSTDNVRDITIAEQFSNFFANKCKVIKQDLERNKNPSSSSTSLGGKVNIQVHSDHPNFSKFDPANEEAVRKIILNSPSTTCQLDPVPTVDTISHDIFLSHLPSEYGFSGSALKWFESYFTSRSQAVVVVNEVSSASHFPKEGIPQGSVLGPLCFSMYTSPLEKIIENYGVERMTYADDTQIYAVLTESDREAVIDNLEHCLFNIKEWSTQNYLKLNSDKTEVIHVKSSLRNPSPLSVINVADTAIEPTTRARDLGVILDSGLDMQYHVGNKCKSAAMGLHKIGKIRQQKKLMHL